MLGGYNLPHGGWLAPVSPSEIAADITVQLVRSPDRKRLIGTQGALTCLPDRENSSLLFPALAL